MAKSALIIARAACPSRTLRRAMHIVQEEDGQVFLRVPHYWARFYHDGRGPVHAQRASHIIFYRNPSEDPRIKNGHPVRVADINRLKKSDFLKDRAAGKLIITKSVRATGGDAKHPFFSQGLADFAEKANRIGNKQFTKWLLEQVESETSTSTAG